MNRRLRNNKGQSLIIAGVSFATLLVVSGVGIDGARLFLVKADLQRAVDMAAVNSLITGSRTDNTTTTSEAAKAIVHSNLDAQKVPNIDRGAITVDVRSVGGDANTQGRLQATISASVKMHPLFLKYFGIDNIPIYVTAKAKRNRAALAILLDISGSMSLDADGNGPLTSSKVDFLKTAAKSFIDYFDDNVDYLTLITFNDNAHVVIPMNKLNKAAFKADIDAISVSSSSPGHAVSGNTNMAEALARGRIEMAKAVIPPDALKNMVVFSDGAPTVMTVPFLRPIVTERFPTVSNPAVLDPSYKKMPNHLKPHKYIPGYNAAIAPPAVTLPRMEGPLVTPPETDLYSAAYWLMGCRNENDYTRSCTGPEPTGYWGGWRTYLYGYPNPMSPHDFFNPLTNAAMTSMVTANNIPDITTTWKPLPQNPSGGVYTNVAYDPDGPTLSSGLYNTGVGPGFVYSFAMSRHMYLPTVDIVSPQYMRDNAPPCSSKGWGTRTESRSGYRYSYNDALDCLDYAIGYRETTATPRSTGTFIYWDSMHQARGLGIHTGRFDNRFKNYYNHAVFESDYIKQAGVTIHTIGLGIVHTPTGPNTTPTDPGTRGTDVALPDVVIGR